MSAKHRVLKFGDADEAKGPQRLVSFLHIPKTGGTTLSDVLFWGFKSKALPENFGSHINPVYLEYQNRIESGDLDENSLKAIFIQLVDYRDWISLQERHKLYDELDVVLEGISFGAEELFENPRNVFNVTQLRDPLRVFRSNYSYSRVNYALRVSMEDYLTETWSNDFLVHNLAAGDLELAKQRLAEDFSVFGITEQYAKSVRLIGKYFDFKPRDIVQLNKSESERFELDDRIQDIFHKKNKKDIELYEFGLNLFEKRCVENGIFDQVDAEEKIEQVIDDTRSYQIKGRHDDDEVIPLMDQGRFNEAIETLLALPPFRMRDFQALGKCYEEIGDVENSWIYYLKAFELRASDNLTRVMPFFISTDVERVIQIIEGEIVELKKVLKPKPADCFPFHDLVALNHYKIEALKVSNQTEKAAAAIEQIVIDLYERGVSLEIDTHYGRQFHGFLDQLEDISGNIALVSNKIVRDIIIERQSDSLENEIEQLEGQMPHREYSLMISLAETSAKVGDDAGAERWFLKACELDANTEHAYRRLRQIYLERNDSESIASTERRAAKRGYLNI